MWRAHSAIFANCDNDNLQGNRISDNYAEEGTCNATSAGVEEHAEGVANGMDVVQDSGEVDNSVSESLVERATENMEAGMGYQFFDHVDASDDINVDEDCTVAGLPRIAGPSPRNGLFELIDGAAETVVSAQMKALRGSLPKAWPPVAGMTERRVQ